MEITQLKYFLEVAESQHVTKSSEKLHIAQPALTQAIHRLEKELGFPLFASKGRNIILTEYGKYLKARLDPVISAFDSIPEELAIMAKLESETIHLNVLAASSLVTDAIIEFKKTHHKINFQLLQNTGNELFDISITTCIPEHSDAVSNENTCIYNEKIFLAVPNNERYAGKQEISLNKVRNEGFISLIGSHQLRNICDIYCMRENFQPKIIFESDNPSAVKNMIGANIGVGFWPEFSWGEIESDNIILLRISHPDFRRNIIYTKKHNKTNNNAVDEFFTFLNEYTIQKACL